VLESKMTEKAGYHVSPSHNSVGKPLVETLAPGKLWQETIEQ
jgi:hypothetical protein